MNSDSTYYLIQISVYIAVFIALFLKKKGIFIILLCCFACKPLWGVLMASSYIVSIYHIMNVINICELVKFIRVIIRHCIKSEVVSGTIC